MANKQDTERTAVRTPPLPSLKNEHGFTYIELLVTFALTMVALTSILTVSGQMVAQKDYHEDQGILQREASALQFLLTNELKQGYRFRVINGDLIFQLNETEAIQLQHSGTKLTRHFSRQGANGPFEGDVTFSRHVDEVTYRIDADRRGVAIQIVLKKGEATLTQRTYWRSRIERGEG